MFCALRAIGGPEAVPGAAAARGPDGARPNAAVSPAGGTADDTEYGRGGAAISTVGLRFRKRADVRFGADCRQSGGVRD